MTSRAGLGELKALCTKRGITSFSVETCLTSDLDEKHLKQQIRAPELANWDTHPEPDTDSFLKSMIHFTVSTHVN